jgi:hypothetical protein
MSDTSHGHRKNHGLEDVPNRHPTKLWSGDDRRHVVYSDYQLDHLNDNLTCKPFSSVRTLCIMV